jgi:class 3 adenylate cyclase
VGEPPDTRYVDVDDSEIAYQVVGDGPIDLLYFAGLGSHVDVLWEYEPSARFFSRLASFSRLLLFDRRGTGASAPIRDAERSTWETWADDLLAVLDASGSSSTAIFAEADAGPTAILFAALHPERVRALILANTTSRYLVDDDYAIGLPRDMVEILVHGISATWGTKAAVRMVQPDAGDEVVRWAAKLMRAAAPPKVAAQQYRYILESMDVRAMLPLVHSPTLVLHNADQPFPPIGHGRHLATQIADATFVQLPPSDGYFSPRGYDRVVDEVARFLGHAHEVESDRVLTTLLFTDIVGSTNMAVSMGDRQWRSVLDQHDRVVRAALGRYRGREVDTTGDGFLACFDSPSRAIRCARAIAEDAARIGVTVRAGLHAGECEVRGDNLGGVNVHIAARVAALAGAGEVLTSASVEKLVAGSGIVLRDRGDHALRGVPDRWQLFEVDAVPA